MILIRHGESAFNAAFNRTRIDPGIRDAPLTERGRRQAEAAAEGLRALGLRRLVASPYTRTLETAAIIAERLDLPVTIEPLVRERAFFICDIGSRRSELERVWPGLSFDAIDEHWWPAAEESEHDLRARCLRFRDSMALADDWPHVGVITHWGFIRALAGLEVRNCQAIRFDPMRQVGHCLWPPAVEHEAEPC
jgi:broad specificity phosphatase PhoE